MRPLAPVIAVLAAGAMAGAYVGAGLSRVCPSRALELVNALCCCPPAIGVAMAAEAFLPEHGLGIADDLAIRVPVAALIGVAIGTLSSLAVPAGGELIATSFVFVFGLAIKPAGTASSLASFALVSVGCVKHARAGAYHDRGALRDLVVPMGAASIAGALVGARLVEYVPAGP